MGRDIMEVLNALSPHAVTSSIPGRGQGPRFTAGEVAAMLSGLPRPVVCLAFGKYAIDQAASDELAAWLRLEALNARRRQGWGDTQSDDRRWALLAVMARDDLTLSRPTPGRAQRAQTLGVSERQWRAVWSDRHAHLLNVGHGWHSALTYALMRQLRGHDA
jgi:hypothetical protein